MKNQSCIEAVAAMSDTVKPEVLNVLTTEIERLECDLEIANAAAEQRIADYAASMQDQQGLLQQQVQQLQQQTADYPGVIRELTEKLEAIRALTNPQ